jgi:hypothetical protein
MIKFLAAVLFSLFFVTACFAQESLTISTYYPSPYGSYNELQLYPHVLASTICPSTARGTIIYDSSDDALKVCNGSSWVSVGGTTAAPTGDVNAPGNTWGSCAWKTVPSGSRNWTCDNGEFVAGIGYEGTVWTSVTDDEVYPEVNQLYCCKI